MGTTAEYVMVSKQELEQLLSGCAIGLADQLYDERYGLSAPFEPPKIDLFQAELAANPLLMLDQNRIRSYVEGIMSKVQEQQALSRQRMLGSDAEEKLDEVIKLYAWGVRPWSSADTARSFAGLTEDELAREALKRGHHLRLDLDKRWNTMHQLLTGVTLAERNDLAALAIAKPWIEKAKNNVKFSRGSVSDIEAATKAVFSMDKEMKRLRDQLQCTVSATSLLSDDDPGHTPKSDALVFLQDLEEMVRWTPDALFKCLMQVAALQKKFENGGVAQYNTSVKNEERIFRDTLDLFGNGSRIDHTFMSWEQCELGVAESAKSAKLIESLMNDIMLKLRTNEFTEVNLETAKQIAEASSRLTKSLSVAGWGNEFDWRITCPEEDAVLSNNELLSLAMSGGSLCPGTNAHDARYLTVQRTAEIASVLAPLTSIELAGRHYLCQEVNSPDFYQFRKFYMRAAQLGSGIFIYFL